MTISVEKLIEGCADDAFDAGISIRSKLEPMAGPGATVKPAIYEGPRYQMDARWVGEGEDRRNVEAIVIDNVPSQANRLEAGLEGCAREVGLPDMVIDFSDYEHLPPHVPSRLSSFVLPHRCADSYLRDSTLDEVALTKTDLGKAIFTASAQNPLALVQYMPQSLLYGFWQSHFGKHGPQTKLARSWTSEIVGYEPAASDVRRLGLKGDPYNLHASDALKVDADNLIGWEFVSGKAKSGAKSEKLSAIGHGQVPVSASEATLGGVSFREIEQIANVTFAGLRNIDTGDSKQNAALRALLVSLGILAHAKAFNRGFSLRSNADLITVATRWMWLSETGRHEIEAPTVAQAEELFVGCVKAGEAAGLPVGSKWASEPIELKPNASLMKAVEKTFPEFDW